MLVEPDYVILYNEEITIVVGGVVIVVYWFWMGLINIFEFILFVCVQSF
jgi:hypothetical protein